MAEAGWFGICRSPFYKVPYGGFRMEPYFYFIMWTKQCRKRHGND